MGNKIRDERRVDQNFVGLYSLSLHYWNRWWGCLLFIFSCNMVLSGFRSQAWTVSCGHLDTSRFSDKTNGHWIIDHLAMITSNFFFARSVRDFYRSIWRIPLWKDPTRAYATTRQWYFNWNAKCMERILLQSRDTFSLKLIHPSLAR